MAVRYPKRVSRPLESSRGPGYEIADQADYNLNGLLNDRLRHAILQMTTEASAKP